MSSLVCIIIESSNETAFKARIILSKVLNELTGNCVLKTIGTIKKQTQFQIRQKFYNCLIENFCISRNGDLLLLFVNFYRKTAGFIYFFDYSRMSCFLSFLLLYLIFYFKMYIFTSETGLCLSGISDTHQ